MSTLTLGPGPTRDTLEKAGIIKPPKVPDIAVLVEAAAARGLSARYSATEGDYSVCFTNPDGEKFEFKSDIPVDLNFRAAERLALALESMPQQESLF